MEMLAEKMIIKGLSMDDIAEITELTVEKLIEIKQKYGALEP